MTLSLLLTPIHWSLITSSVQAKPAQNSDSPSEGDRLYQQSLQLYRQGRLREALTTLQQFLEVSRQSGNRSDERAALNNIGLIYRSLSDYPNAVRYYQQALELGREIGDRADEGTILNNIGVVYERMGQNQQALDYFQQALTTRRANRDRRGEGQTLNSLGIVYNNLGQYDRAVASYQQALAIAREVRNVADQAQVLNNLGTTQDTLGNYQQALTFYQQSLALYTTLNDRLGQGAALNSLGSAHANLGRYAQALEFYNQSLEIRQEVGDRAGEAATLNSLGLLHRNLGQYAQALAFLNQALSIRQQIGDRTGEATSLNQIGGTYTYLEQYAQAISSLQQALPIWQEVGDRSGEASTLNNLGLAYAAQAQYEQALPVYQQVLQITRALGDRTGEAAALNNIGEAYANLGQLAQANETLQQALRVVQAVGDRRGESITLSNLGANLLSSGKFAEAETTLFAAANALESLRPGLSDPNKIAIFDTQTYVYRLLQFALISQNKVNAALEVAERGRARAFVELLATRLSSTSPSQISSTPINIQQIQQIARTQNATLVEYSIIGDNRLYIWVVNPTGEIAFRQVELTSLGIPLAQAAERSRVAAATGRSFTRGDLTLENLVSTTRSSLGVQNRTATDSSTSPRFNRDLQQLHQLLIQPIADLLPTDPGKRVIFIPQDALFLTPFAALQDATGQYLIEQHTLLIAPSIQVLALTHQQRRFQPPPSDPPNILIVGNPTMPNFSPSPEEPPRPLPPLPYSETEARAIAALFNTQPLIGSQATETTVVQRMGQAQLIHLATHGLLDDVLNLGIPGAIALTPTSTSDGFLTASETLNLNLQAQLVVLSACNTGRGRITGDGVVGLSRSFIGAGVPSVIVSLWAVPDDSTSTLMEEFYRNLQHRSDKAQALRQAMLTLLQTPQSADPRNWAAFALIGEAE